MKMRLNQRLLAGLSASALAFAFAPMADALTVRDDVTVPGSEERADDPQYDGVVQIYMVSPSGGIFFNCTGSLINPRTVISAAHCFNDLPSSAYGTQPGQYTPLVAYGPDTFDGLFNWLDTGLVQLDARNGVVFGEQVIVHPDADPAFGAQLPFPGADVSLVALTDPLAHLPTYSMLFSQVPVGTHVQMVGYGSHGTGLTGDVSIDGKRQAGENILGLVGSQADFYRGAFGNNFPYFTTPSPNQLLYFTDFDNPDRDTSVCSRENDYFGYYGLVCDAPGKPINGLFGLDNDVVVLTDDIDWFPGDALPNEAGTAGGDSGSPLFADQLVSDQLIITGVLSGGFSFTAPAPSGYGDVSYYNPLFLFYDFIAEANPYKYVGSVEGDGTWSDGDHWVQLLDPAYLIIDSEGNVVNGLPDGAEPGVGTSDPRDGIVFDVDITDLIPPAVEDAPEAAGSVELVPSILDAATNRASDQLLTTLDGNTAVAANDAATGAVSIAQVSLDWSDELAAAPVAEPELVTYLYGDVGSPGPWTGPGATGAVPNNGANSSGFVNYFDVTLAAAGTTTTDMDVIIDKLTLANADATLAIGGDYIFFSLIETQIAAGTLDVGGIFVSRDILNGGMLLGSGGEIYTDTLFNLGLVDAGTGLDVYGDLVLTSGGALGYSGSSLDVDGDVSIDGLVLFESYASGQSGRLLTYTGERVGEFSLANFNNNQGVRKLILSESALEGATAIDFAITAEQFSQFLGGSELDGNGLAMAALLDASRQSSFDELRSLYDTFDFLPAADLAGPLSRLSPDVAFQAPGLSGLSGSSLPQHLDRRMTGLRNGTASPRAFNSSAGRIQLASLNDQAMAGLISQAEASSEAGGGTSPAADRKFGVFGEVSMSVGSQTASISGIEGDIEATSITLGFDGEMMPGTMLGVFGNYSEGDSDFNSGIGTSDAEGYLLGVYGTTSALGIGDLSGYAGFGQRDFDTARAGAFTTLTGSTDADEIIAGLGLSRDYVIDPATGFVATPEVRIDYQNVDIAGYTETGDITAMEIAGRDVTSLMVKLGGDVHLYDPSGDGAFRPSVGARIVYDLDGKRDTATARFAAGGGETTLVGASRDKAWGELRGALNFGASDSAFKGALFAEGTFDRQDLSYVTVGVNLRAEF